MWMVNLAHFSDLEKLDQVQSKSCKWSERETSGKHPGKLAYHTTSIIGDTAYLIGGSCEESENEGVYTLYMNSFEWRQVKTSGDHPGSIDEHSAVVYNRNIIVFGGYRTSGRTNNIWVLNTEEKHWTLKQGGEDPRRFPCPRSGHSACVMGEVMWVFGGQGDVEKLNDLWKYNIHFGTWD